MKGKYFKKNKTEIQNAFLSLTNKINNLDIDSLILSDYYRRYFNEIANKKNLTNTLNKYKFILLMAIKDSNEMINNLTFMDYGGGTGILSMLAKEANFKNVIYSDIYKPSCIESCLVATKMGIKCDHYVLGDIDKVINYVKENSLNVDVIGNYDVIEHVYDIKYFLENIKYLSNSKISIFLASGANGANPKINFQMTRLHEKMEFIGREYTYGRKPTDATLSLLKMRKVIISNEYPQLNEKKIDLLARATRGLTKADILKALQLYFDTGKIPNPNHPTNTCDPLTGNWFEQILNPFLLTSDLKKQGFSNCEVFAGRYFSKNNYIKKLLNLFIIIFPPRLSLIVSPFYAIKGYKK